MESKRKAVAYIRVSSYRQIDNESPETQRTSIQNYADTNNIQILEWFYDEGKSGKNADREELQNLLKFALKYKGKIDHVIVYNMKRASRDLDSYVEQVRLVLKTKGITVRSSTEPMVDDTKIGRFMESFLVLMGQLDNEGKAEVTIDNMRSLAVQGYWQHPPVVGYDSYKILNDKGKPRPSLKQNASANKVRAVLERFSIGDISKAELARFASDSGLRSRYGKKLGEDSINRLLKNPVYAGYVSDKFTEYELVQGKHLGIISPDIYERNQSLLYIRNSRRGETHLQKNGKYPLKGLIKCSNCQKKLYASAPTTGNGGSSPRYHCARASCRGLVKSVRARQVHDDFEQLLARVKPSEGILGLYRTVLVRTANEELGKLNKHIATIREELTVVDNSRVNVLQKLTEGVISADEKGMLTDHLDQQKLQKSTELTELEKQQNIREADIDFAINVMNDVDKQWAESDIDIKVRFQNMMFPEGLMYDSINGRFGTSSISPLYRVLANKKGSEEPFESHLVAAAGLELMK